MRNPNRKQLQRWETVVGVACFVAGILAPLLGMFLLVIEWMAGVTLHAWLHNIGTTLLILGIPLVLFAGFCLDWAEAGQKVGRLDSKGTQQGAASLAAMGIIGNPLGVVLLTPGELHQQQTRPKVATTDVLKRGSETSGG